MVSLLTIGLSSFTVRRWVILLSFAMAPQCLQASLQVRVDMCFDLLPLVFICLASESYVRAHGQGLVGLGASMYGFSGQAVGRAA